MVESLNEYFTDLKVRMLIIGADCMYVRTCGQVRMKVCMFVQFAGHCDGFQHKFYHQTVQHSPSSCGPFLSLHVTPFVFGHLLQLHLQNRQVRAASVHTHALQQRWRLGQNIISTHPHTLALCRVGGRVRTTSVCTHTCTNT